MTKNYNTNYFYAFSFLIMLLLSNMSQAQTTTWTGSWDNGDPDITKDVIFTANYTSPSNISAKSVLVSGGAQVTIASNHTFTIENNITVAVGSNLIFETNASLLQINPTAINKSRKHRIKNKTKRYTQFFIATADHLFLKRTVRSPRSTS